MRKRFIEVHGSSEKQIADAFNKARNFTKHADKDPDALIEDVSDFDAETVIMVACVDYCVLAGKSPIPVGLFITWFAAVYPDRTGSFFKREAEDWFPGLGSLDREAQVSAARTALAKPVPHEVLNARRTELTDNWRWVELRKKFK